MKSIDDSKKINKLTTLCYIEQGESYLMLFRNKKENDQSKGKWLGVGGKLEKNESPDDCVKREVLEETGITLSNYKCRGFITFISDQWENEIMFLYTGYCSDEKINEVCKEGRLEWIPKNKIMDLNMWEGDRIFLKELMEGKEFINLKLIYEGDKLVSWENYSV